MDQRAPGGDSGLFDALRRGEAHDPHSVLGAHPARRGHDEGVVVRAYHPDASGCELVRDMSPPAWMTALGGGVFEIFMPDVRAPLAYRLRFHFHDGGTWERDDPYRFLPTLGELDLHLIGEGAHRRLWQTLGSQVE